MTATMSAAEYQASWNPDEATFQAEVVREAEANDWCCWHDNDSRRNAAGMVDLICAKPGRPLLLWELKTRSGRVRPMQRFWVDLLSQALGVHTGVFRPADWTQMREILSGEATHE